MSQLFRRINGIFFSASLQSSRILHLSARTYVSSVVKPLTRTEEPPADPRIYDLLHEPKLRKMVDKFKLLSSEIFFRKRLSLYEEMVGRLTFAKKFSWIEEILEHQRQYMYFPANESLIREVIKLYGNAGMFDHARRLFNEMPQLNYNPDVISFNFLLEACINSNCLDLIEDIFSQIPSKLSITPNWMSYTILIKAYSKMESLDSMLATMNEMEEKGIKPKSLTYAIVLDGFYKNDKVSEGDLIWESMRSKGIVPCINCYNSKLFSVASDIGMDKAIELFNSLKSEGLKPNKCTFSVMLKGFSEEKDLESAKKWYNKLGGKDYRGSIEICEILVPFATEMGDFEFAQKLCRAAIANRSFLKEETLQGVLDMLVKESKVEEAKNLLDGFKGYGGGGVYTCKVKKTAF